MNEAISVRNVTKSYGKVTANNDISLSVGQEEIYGLIGPDGAGKTTLIRSICTLIEPDEGNISVLGLDTREEMMKIRKIIGYMPQEFSLYQDLSVEQNLHFFADLFKVPPEERESSIEELYEFSKLGQFKKRLAGDLSGGMKQKLALSCNLVHTPDILILDEPTFGVDPLSRLDFWDMLRKIREDGIPIFVSTAYMDEAEQCDRIALIHQGEIIAIDFPEDIISEFEYTVIRVTGELREIREYFRGLPQQHTVQLFGHEVHVTFSQDPSEGQMREWKEDLGGSLQDIQRIKPGIADIFLEKMAE